MHRPLPGGQTWTGRSGAWPAPGGPSTSWDSRAAGTGSPSCSGAKMSWLVQHRGSLSLPEQPPARGEARTGVIHLCAPALHRPPCRGGVFSNSARAVPSNHGCAWLPPALPGKQALARGHARHTHLLSAVAAGPHVLTCVHTNTYPDAYAHTIARTLTRVLPQRLQPGAQPRTAAAWAAAVVALRCPAREEQQPQGSPGLWPGAGAGEAHAVWP